MTARRFKWILSTVGTYLLVYLWKFEGMEGARNLFVVFTILYAAIAVLCLSEDTRAYLATTGPSVPRWLDSGADMLLAGFLIWHGHISLGLGWVLILFCTALAFTPPNKRVT